MVTKITRTSEIFLITFLDIKEKNRERTLIIYDDKLHVNEMYINHDGVKRILESTHENQYQEYIIENWFRHDIKWKDINRIKTNGIV